MAHTVVTRELVQTEAAFVREMDKRAAECGWNGDSQNTLLVRFLASQARFRTTLLAEFRTFLEEQAQFETATVLPETVAEDEDEEEDEDEDEDEEDEEDDTDDYEPDDDELEEDEEWDDDEDDEEEDDEED